MRLEWRGDLPGSPDVRAEFPARDRATSVPVDGDGQILPAALHVYGAVDRGQVDAAAFSQFFSAEAFGSLDHDTRRFALFAKVRKGSDRFSCEIAENAILPHHLKMAGTREKKEESWPKRTAFLAYLDKALAEGFTYTQVAEALRLRSTRSLEHEWRYDKDRRPGRKTLELAAEFFHVPFWHLDGPDPDDFGSKMAAYGDQLTPEWRQKLLEMAELAVQSDKGEK